MPIALPVLFDVALIVALGSIMHLRAARRRDSEKKLRRKLVAVCEDHAQCNRHVQMLSELNHALQSSETLEEAVELTVPFLPRLFAVPSGALWVAQPPGKQLSLVYGWGDEPHTETVLPSECRALLEGRPIAQPLPPDPRRCKHLGGTRSAAPRDFDPASAEGGRALASLQSVGDDRRAVRAQDGLRPGALDPSRSEDLCVPLAVNGVTLALLNLHDPRGHARALLESPFLVSAIEQIALAIWNLTLRETLRQQSIRDPLTRLYNRRYLEESLPREMSRAERGRAGDTVSGLAVMMIDVDHFKHCNDEFGHQAGDAVLSAIAATLRDQTRGSDIASRYGGEEFVLALADVSLEDACARAEQIRAAVEALEISFGGKRLLRTTISLGLAFYPDHTGSPDELIKAADAAMYAAKRGGRNCVRVAPVVPPS